MNFQPLPHKIYLHDPIYPIDTLTNDVFSNYRVCKLGTSDDEPDIYFIGLYDHIDDSNTSVFEENGEIIEFTNEKEAIHKLKEICKQ